MNIPQPISDWLTKKTNHPWATIREAREVDEEFKRQTGGRIMYARLSVCIEPAESFIFEVDANEIHEDYIAGAEDAAIGMLLFENWAPILNCKLRLYNFRPIDGESSYKAFYYVSKLAMGKLLGISSDSEHNIKWE